MVVTSDLGVFFIYTDKKLRINYLDCRFSWIEALISLEVVELSEDDWYDWYLLIDESSLKMVCRH